MATKNAVGNSLTGSTGSGSFVGATSPTLVTPALGTPSSGTLTNCTGLPVAGGGTGVASTTAYAVLCGGTTSTGALQSITGVGSSGEVLTSNGAGALPTFQAVSGTTAAAQSDQETATSTTTFVSPGRQQYHPSAAKVWCLFNTVTTTTILASYNVSSLTDGGAGLTTINFTTSFSSANYGIAGISQGLSGTADRNLIVDISYTTNPTAGALAVMVGNSANALSDVPRVSIICFGDQ